MAGAGVRAEIESGLMLGRLMLGQSVHFIVLAQVLSDLRVAVLIIGYNNVSSLSCGHACLAVELSREIALPVLFVLADVLNAKGESVMDEQRLAPLA